MLPNIPKSKKTIYLDHAATTYLDPRVKAAMEPFLDEIYGNPSSLHHKGQEAARAINESRQIVADVLGARPREIIFTAGGTESVNLAIFGVARQLALDTKKKGHIISLAIEHHSVLRSIEALEEEGWAASIIPVDQNGFIRLDKLKAAVRPDTILISVMYANNEIGTIEPIAEIGKWLRSLNIERSKQSLAPIYFHTDACQAAGALDLNVNKLGVDFMSINGSKIYGPKQVGALYVRTGTPLRALIFGGQQERNLRSGTENVAGIVGFAQALQLAQAERTKENLRLRKLRDYFIDSIFSAITDVSLNGAIEQRSSHKGTHQGANDMVRLPNNINISIEGVEGEDLLLYLDSYNIAVSTGSACTTGIPADPSHVLSALGKPAGNALGSLRLTLGKQTTKKYIDYVMKVLPGVVAQLRAVKSFNNNKKPVKKSLKTKIKQIALP